MTTIRLLITKEYAERRHCSPRTIERERTAGTGCSYVKIGRLVLYRETDVEAFIEAHLRRSTSEPDTPTGVRRVARSRRVVDRPLLGQKLHKPVA
jgi:hypothetical protein